MTARTLQLREHLLWPLSIMTGLLLQTALASFLWGICTSLDDIQPPTLRLISLSQAVTTPQPVPETIKPAIENTPPAPVIAPVTLEQTIVEPEPVIERKPVVQEPIKPAPEAVKAKAKAIKPKVKPVRKAEPQPDPIPSPVMVEASPAITTTQPVVTKTVPAVKSAVAQQSAAANSETSAAPVNPQDFSSYLQKIYRQLEKNKRYPADARRHGISGKVAVAFSISAEGKAVGAVVTSKSPHELANAALKLVASQRFANPPAGWSSASRIEMQISYSLR